MITVLAATMALGIMPMVAVGVLAPLLIDDLGISRAEIGILVAVVAGVSALLSPLVGETVDRIGDRTALLAGLTTGAAALALMAAAFDYASMAAALAVAGVCRAGCNPATNRLIRVRLAAGSRGWITGVKQSGEAVAIVVVAGAVPALAALWSWRAALLALSALTAVALISARIFIDGSRTATRDERQGQGSLRGSIHWLNAHCLLMGAGAGAITGYLPLYAHEVASLSVAAAGGVVVVAGVAGGVFRILWSHWSEKRFGFPASLAWLAALAAGSTVVLMLTASIGASACWAGAALWGASGLAFGSVAMMAVMAEADDWNTGRASGLLVLWFGVGFTAMPPLFGWLLERSDGYGPGLGLVAGLYLVALAIIITGRSSFRSPAGSTA